MIIMSLFEVHPLFVHFPIALLSTAVLFDVFSVFTGREDLAMVGWWTMLMGLISAVTAMTTGILADTNMGHFGSVFPIWINHGWTQVFASILFMILFIWRGKPGNIPRQKYQKWVYLTLSLLAVAVLFYGGHLGARLATRI